MADNTKHKIKDLLQKLSDDMNQLCCLLIKAGYAAGTGKGKCE